MTQNMLAGGISSFGEKNKIFCYSVLTLNAVAAWISWWVLAGAIFGRMQHVWLYPILAFSFWAIAFTLLLIFVRNRKYIHLSFLFAALGYPLFFGPSLSLSGLVLAMLLLVLTEIQTKKEIARGIKIDFYHLVSHTLKYFVTAACILIAVAYYFSITEKTAASPTAISTKTLEMEIDWGLKAASMALSDEKKELVDDIAQNMSVDEFLSKNFVAPGVEENITVAKSIIPNGPTEMTKAIGDAAATKIHEEMLAKSKRDLSKQLGVDVVGERPMKEVLMSYIDKTERSFFEYTGTDKFYIPIILAFGLFLTARILGTAVDILLGLFILGLIKILRSLEVIQLGYEQKEVTTIEYEV